MRKNVINADHSIAGVDSESTRITQDVDDSSFELGNVIYGPFAFVFGPIPI